MKIIELIKAYYNKPNNEKSKSRIVLEMLFSVIVGALAGWSGTEFAMTLNALWLLLTIPCIIHVIGLTTNIRMLNKKMKEADEAFKKEYGVDMLTYCKQELEKTEGKNDSR